MAVEMSAEIEQAETELLLKAFRDFKEMIRTTRLGGELRVAMEVDKASGEPEIIFAGYNFKRSLDGTRTVYTKRREQVTFGRGVGSRLR